MCTGTEEQVPARGFNINWASELTSLRDDSSMLHYLTLAFTESSASAAAVPLTQPVQPRADWHHREVLGLCCC